MKVQSGQPPTPRALAESYFVADPTLRFGAGVGYQTNSVFKVGILEAANRCLS